MHQKQMNTAFTFGCTFLLCALAVVCRSEATAETHDEKFIAGLNDRRLFELAEVFCQRRLAEQELTGEERLNLTIALCRTYARHALHTPRSRRQPLWQAAEQAIAQFHQARPDSPRRVLIDMQHALTVLARGELARQEAEVGAPGAPSWDEARRELQQAVTQLRGIADEVERLLRGAPAVPDGRSMSEIELLSLERNVRHQTARALRNQALCYPPQSAERSDTLIRALQLLTPLAQLDTIDPLIWKARLDEAKCLRLRQKLSDAVARLDALDAARPPSKVRLQSRAQRVRVFLDAKRPDDALAVLRQGREIAGQTSADYDLAHVETFIALWRKSAEGDDPQAASAWQQRAANMVKAMEGLYGPYWTRRGEMLLAASAAAGGGGENLDVLTSAAKNHYLRKEFDEAVVAYERAGAAALQAGDRSRAFDLLLAAALIERRRDRRTEAIRRQRELSTSLRDQAKAPSVHLQATLDMAQVARDGTRQSLEHYVTLLQEHIELWPDEATSDKARLWLGRLHEHQHNWSAAIEAYSGVGVDDQQKFLAALDHSAHCYNQLLTQARDSGDPAERTAEAAAQRFEEVVVGSDNRLPQRFSPAQRQAALHAARLRLQFTTQGFAAAQRLLEAALADAADASASWKSQARSLLVVAQAGAGNLDAARQTLQRLTGGSPAAQLEMLRGLREVGQLAQPKVARQVAMLQLDVARRLRVQAGELSATGRVNLDLIQAQALAAAGYEDDARGLLAKLSEQNPDHAEIQLSYARLLLRDADPQSQRTALDQWRNILRRSRPQSPQWYEAKYALAVAHYRLGERERTAQMIELLQAVHPEMGGAAMKRKLLQLLERCRS